MLHGVADGEQPSVFLSFGANEDVAFKGSSHDANMFGSAHIVWKAVFGNLITSKTSFNHTGSVVYHDRLVGDHIVGFHGRRISPSEEGTASRVRR